MKNNPSEVFKVARTAKGYQARQRILIATAELLGECGVDNITVLAICEHANIGRTTLYNYFTDSSDVIQELLSEFVTEIQSQFEQIHGDKPRGTIRLAYCLRFLMERSWRDPVWGKLAINLRDAGPAFDTYMKEQINLEINGAIVNNELTLTKQELDVLSPFISSIVTDMCRKLSSREAALKEITPIIALSLRAAGATPSLVKQAVSQKLSRALFKRSWLISE